MKAEGRHPKAELEKEGKIWGDETNLGRERTANVARGHLGVGHLLRVAVVDELDLDHVAGHLQHLGPVPRAVAREDRRHTLTLCQFNKPNKQIKKENKEQKKPKNHKKTKEEGEKENSNEDDEAIK
jgi:hypothetical protein